MYTKEIIKIVHYSTYGTASVSEIIESDDGTYIVRVTPRGLQVTDVVAELLLAKANEFKHIFASLIFRVEKNRPADYRSVQVVMAT